MMQKNSGNALWLILIAIFLLGGLTVMLTRSGGQSEETGATDKAIIHASKMLSYTASIQAAVSNLLMRGCSENQLSFWTDTNNDGLETVADTNYNASAPADRSCHIFDVKGAGISASGGDEDFSTASILNVGTTAIDIYYVSQFDYPASTIRGISDAVCTSINSRVENGLNISSLPRADLTTNSFAGNLTAGLVLGDNGTEIGMAGIKTGCIIDVGCGTGTCNTFYSVVHIR